MGEQRNLFWIGVIFGGCVGVYVCAKDIYLRSRRRRKKRERLLGILERKSVIGKHLSSGKIEEVVVANAEEQDGKTIILHPNGCLDYDNQNPSDGLTLGDYLVVVNDKSVKIRMTNTIISPRCWLTHRNVLSQFPETNEKYLGYKKNIHSVVNYSHVLLNFMKLTLIGTVSVENEEIIFRPDLIVNSLNAKKQIQSLFAMGGRTKVKIMILFLVGLCFMRAIPFMLRCVRNLFFQLVDHYKRKAIYYQKPIRAKQSDKLMCQQCNVNTSTIIMDCRHLTLCRDCYEKKGKIVRCYLCNKRTDEAVHVFV